MRYILIVALSVSTCVFSVETRALQLDLAKHYVETEQFPEALHKYENLLSENPKDCEVRQFLIDLYLRFARLDAKNYKHQSALNWYVAAIGLNPNLRTSLLREYADQVSRGGRGPESVILYKEVISNEKTTPEEVRLAKLGLAQTYVWLNQNDEARQIYDTLPNDEDALKGKSALGQNKERLETHEQKKERLKQDPEKKLELATALNWYSEFDEAIPLYQEILKEKLTSDQEREATLGLAKAYSGKYQYDDALKLYDSLLSKNHYDARAKQGKARVYIDYANYNAGLGKHKEAIEWYYKAIENDPIKRPELLPKIAQEQAILGDKVVVPKSPYEMGLEACTIQERVPEPLKPIKTQEVPEGPRVTPAEPQKAPSKPEESPPQKEPSQPSVTPVEPQKPLPQKEASVPRFLPVEPDVFWPQEKGQVDSNTAKTDFDKAIDYAKYLQVFKAKRAFEASLAKEPENRIYRENYAWHLHNFSFFQEAVSQFEALLPSDKISYYEALGFDYRRIGQLRESIWAFSNIYHIPHCLTLNNQYLIANNIFRSVYYEKMYTSESKKEMFEIAAYLGELELASGFAAEILNEHPEEYMVHYRYAVLLYQKRLFREAVIQFELLLEKLPGNAFLYFSLGKVFEDMCCLTRAEASYHQALLIDDNPETERAYARILSKLCDCESAYEISGSIETETLTRWLSNAEVSLNCGDYCNAASIYRSVLEEYPYNPDALWGLLKSSTYTGNVCDALVSYRRWPNIWFREPVQNLLANYYRPPELSLPAEYYHESTTFTRFSFGLNYSRYVCDDTRFFAKSYFTHFSKKHFNSINRQSAYLGFDKLFNESWEFQGSLIENYYKPLQRGPENEHLYSKAVLNGHAHLVYHKLPEFYADLGIDYYDVIDTVPPFNNPIYNYANQIGSLALNIRTTDVNLFLNYNKEKIYWLANFVCGRYSDGNTKTVRTFRGGYQFANVPESYIFYSYFYLNFRHAAPLFTQNSLSESAYYDPKNFEIHSIGLTSKYDFTEKLQVGGELALLYVPKVEDFAYSSFVYFNYQASDCLSYRLDVRYYYQTKGVTRTGTTGYYYADNVNFQINYAF